MKTRREFIKTASLLTAGAMALNAFPLHIPNPKDKMIGLQLWTLRDSIQKDTLETLKKISEIGYTSIEPYGFDGSFYGYPAGDFRKIIEDLGMKLTSTHTGITLENAAKFIESGAETGLEYLVLPSFMGRPDKTADDFKRMADELNKIGEMARGAGIHLGYHNHDFEFAKSGETIHYDILLNETDTELVCFQLDIYWIIKGGQDPQEYFEKYPGRFELWHVKDMDEKGESTIVGAGTIDYNEIFAHTELSGMKRFYVEQESYVKDPIQDVRESYRYISENLI